MKIHLDIDERHGRVELRSGWRPSIAAECKSVVGWRWSKTKNAWTYPLSMATLRRMREVFGAELAPSPELLRWARAERKTEKRTKGYAVHHDALLASVPTLAPILAEAMKDRTYQRSAARFAAVAGSYLLADEPGLGKTATILASIMESNLWRGEHLVVSPKTAIHPTWVRQIQHWTGATVYGMPEGAVPRAKEWAAFQVDNSDTKFLIVNPTMLSRFYGHYCKACEVWEEDVKNGRARWSEEHHTTRGHTTKRMVMKESWGDIIDARWTTVTVDESHTLFASYKPSNVTQAVQGLLDIESDARYALTGTPLRGQEVNIWGTLDWLGVNTGGYWSFVDNYMEQRQGFFGVEVFGLDPEKDTEFHRLIDRYVLRRTRAEARPDLPLGQRVDVMVEMSKSHRKQYEEFREEGEATIRGGTLSAQGLLSELTRLKQMSWGEWEVFWNSSRSSELRPTLSSAKWEWILEFLAARGITGKKSSSWLPEKGTAYKVTIASQFTEILDTIERELNRKGIQTLKITGAVTGRRRTDAVAKFQSEDRVYRVMLLQSQTGGVSIDLDAWCDEMVILDETWVADDQVQLEGRINNRSGRVSPRMWWYVRTAGTIEESIAERNYEQHDLQYVLLDRRRGVKTALHLIKGEA